jgi:thioredoxin 1
MVKHTRDIDDAAFQKEVLEARGPVLVDFWAPWCGPCRMMAPGLEKVAEKFSGRLEVVKVNVDHNPRWAGRMQVRGIPTLVLFDKGRLVDSRVGFLPEAALERWLEQRLGTEAA